MAEMILPLALQEVVGTRKEDETSNVRRRALSVVQAIARPLINSTCRPDIQGQKIHDRKGKGKERELDTSLAGGAERTEVFHLISKVTQDFVLDHIDILQSLINNALASAGVKFAKTDSSSAGPGTGEIDTPTLTIFLSTLPLLLQPILFTLPSTHTSFPILPMHSHASTDQNQLKKVQHFLLQGIYSFFGHPRSTIRRYAEWGWRCLIFVALIPPPYSPSLSHLYSSTEQFGSMATIPDVLLQKLDTGLGVTIVHLARISGRFKLWEILRVVKIMLVSEDGGVKEDGIRVVLGFLQPDSAETEEKKCGWKASIPTLFFDCPLTSSSASSSPMTKEKSTTMHVEAQNSLISASDVMPLNENDVNMHWDDLVGLFWISLGFFEFPSSSAVSSIKVNGKEGKDVGMKRVEEGKRTDYLVGMA